MTALQKGVDLLVFGAALSPSQQRSVAEDAGVRVIDRNQLILDFGREEVLDFIELLRDSSGPGAAE